MSRLGMNRLGMSRLGMSRLGKRRPIPAAVAPLGAPPATPRAPSPRADRPGSGTGVTAGGADRGRNLLLGGPTRARANLSAHGLARRHAAVIGAKYLLPVMALLLLGALAAWPQLSRTFDQGRVSLRRLTHEVQGAQLTDARYRGLDERGRPYTVTADTAVQVDAERVDLAAPKGDITLENGTWLMVQSQDGTYMQHAQQLDLSHRVVLYRDDGTTLRTETASLDLKDGAAASADPVAADGPFGTLDALGGFTALDKGDVIQFAGPARLVMAGASP